MPKGPNVRDLYQNAGGAYETFIKMREERTRPVLNCGRGVRNLYLFAEVREDDLAAG